jgi:5-methylcytosine-specific restriction enzyme subunit McrC
LMVHPSVGTMIDETVVIQGHPLRFATVDLAAKPADIRAQLLRCFEVSC